MHRKTTGPGLLYTAILLVLPVLLLANLAGGCRQKARNDNSGLTSSQGLEESVSKPKVTEYPVLWDSRPYTDIHKSATQAWFLTENAYYIVQQKWRNSRGEQRKTVEREIDKNIFGVNDKINQLFLDAIKQEPDNALNYATYAMWLKPRKYIKEGGFTNAFPDAIKNIDKAIELWPDEARFYLLKAWIIYSANYCGDWLRAGVDEKLAIAAALPDIEKLYASAEKYDPNNSYINYAHALNLYRFTDPAQFDSIKDTLLREIRAGNRKTTSYFFFPPPLLPYNHDARVAALWGNEVDAVFYDHWNQFGDYPPNSVRAMIDTLASSMSWPQDKENYGELMYFTYALGRTQPYDRSYFHMQQRILDIIMGQQKDNAEELRKLAEEARYLAAQYKSAAQDFYDRKLLKDAKHIDVSGVEQMEQGGARRLNLKGMLQPRQAAYLKHFAEAFGLNLPLPEDSKDW